MRAYVTARVLKGSNGGAAQATRHAVRDEVWWTGLYEAECGKIGALQVGEWAEGDIRNCAGCVRILSRDEVAEARAIARAEYRLRVKPAVVEA